jgi:hypothetical protein
MASQLLPLGSFGLCDVLIILLIYLIELIDKCVGSKIWVVMKGDKGEAGHSAIDFYLLMLYRVQWNITWFR